jgi:rhamnosyltransferase subunit B
MSVRTPSAELADSAVRAPIWFMVPSRFERNWRLPMNAILVTMGTDGDVFPFVALGARLRSRGHRVTLVANEPYQPLASRFDFAFRALVSNAETNEFIGNPDLWHPAKSALMGARWAGPLIDRQYALLSELARDEEAVLVACPPVFAAGLAHEKIGCPLASVIAMPWMIPSVFSPPAMSCGINFTDWTPRVIVRLYWRLLEAAADLLIGTHVNRVRRSIGLKPINRVARWSFSPQLVIGMFPEWYAPAQLDWPGQTMLAGFPLFDGEREGELPKEVIEFCRGGERPIAVTFGTGMRHGAPLFREAIEACRTLGARAILLTKFADQLCHPLPSFVLQCRYAPFGKLFPHCAAVVHHGGIGTTAQALAAGIPQLILPMAWDQPDNARRVQRIGAGGWLKANDRTGPQIARALSRLMTRETRTRCREIAAQFETGDACERAAGWVEELANRSNKPLRSRSEAETL